MIPLKETHLYREIHQQPEVLRRLLDEEEATAQALADLVHGRAIDHVVIAARGTSDNAGRYGRSNSTCTKNRNASPSPR